MDRQTVYYGQLAREVDVLQSQKNTMVALAKFAAAVLGTSTIVNAFTCVPTTPASLNIQVTQGEIYQLANVDGTPWSSLPPDTNTIVKQGILNTTATIGITPPGTVGFSQVFLVECQYQDADGGSLVLPYYNAANPALPFSGPGNAGTAQNTVRQGLATVQVKAGIAAATGTQVAPTADAGWTGLFLVTVANGATTITSGNIALLTTAPFLISTLPNVPYGVQSGAWVYGGTDSGTVNNYAATLYPVPATLYTGMTAKIKMSNSPTGAGVLNCNSLGNRPVIRSGGAPLTGQEWAVGDIVSFTYDGTSWQATPPSVVVRLAANKTLFVNGAIGNDSNDGLSNTAGHALATIQRAVNIAFGYLPSQFTITIQVAAGTYAEAVASPIYSGPNIVINGAGIGSTIVSAGAGHCFSIAGPNTVTVQNLTVQNDAVYPHCGFIAGNGATITTNNTSSGPISIVFEAFSAYVTVGNHTFNNSCYSMYVAVFGGRLSLGGVQTFSAPLSTSFSTAYTGANGSMNPANTFVNPGNVSGTRWIADSNGVFAFPGSNDGTGGTKTYFPGTVAGFAQSGGQYSG